MPRRRALAAATVCAVLMLSPFATAAQRAPGVVDNDAGLRLAQTSGAVVLSANEVRGETIATGPGERLQVLFADNTTLNLGPESEIRIDEFVFDPAAGTARLSATATRGAFRLIGGRTTETEGGIRIATPYGTLTVFQASADLFLGDGAIPAHFHMVFGGGSLALLSASGASLAQVRRPGYAIVPGSGGSAAVQKTSTEWRNAVLRALT